MRSIGSAAETVIDPNFVDMLKQKQRFLLTGHEHPDGDCLGAQVALYHLLSALGKEAFIWNPDPAIQSLDFVLRHTPIHSITSDGPPPEYDVAVLLDCAHLSRLGRLQEIVKQRETPVVVIDHHVGSEDGDGQVGYVDSTAPATGWLVYRLFGEFGVPLNHPAAEGVFLSLVSDTGWFRYSNTNADVHETVGELLRAGVDGTWVYDQMFRRNHSESIDLLTRTLAAAEIGLDGKYANACLDRHQLEHAGRIGFDTDLLMEPLRSVDGVQVVALFKERFDGHVKVSLRATGDIDVEAIARKFGGGGHRKAAGATVAANLDETRSAVRASVEAALAAAERASAGGGA